LQPQLPTPADGRRKTLLRQIGAAGGW
jgi:hypothetical protein